MGSLSCGVDSASCEVDSSFFVVGWFEETSGEWMTVVPIHYPGELRGNILSHSLGAIEAGWCCVCARFPCYGKEVYAAGGRWPLKRGKTPKNWIEARGAQQITLSFPTRPTGRERRPHLDPTKEQLSVALEDWRNRVIASLVLKRASQ